MKWHPGQRTLDSLYPTNAKAKEAHATKEASRDPNWNQSNDPRPKVMYPSMASAEEKAKIAEMLEAQLNKRKALHDKGELGVASIMYETMNDLVSAEMVEQALADDARKKKLDEHYKNDLLYQSMHFHLTEDELIRAKAHKSKD